MKIAIITDVLGEENNGTTITTKRLIENMKKRGHDVRVVSPLTTSEPGYYALKTRNFFIFNNYVAKNGVVLAVPNKQLLREVIADVDVVHILLPFKTGIAALKIANELGKPVTTAFHAQAENVTSHLGMKNFKMANDFVYWRFLKKFYQHTNYVHCPSPFIAGEIKKHGYNMDLRVISNGVNPLYKKMEVQKPQELQDKFCILFIGRLSKEKRHDLLIDAVALSRHQKDIQLIFAGHGPLKEKLDHQGKKLVNQPMIGFFPKEKLVEVINYCDLYVHPSDIEIEAISCLEAITCGRAPIISNSKKSATNAFALTEHNLFEAGNAKSLAEKIDFLFENPQQIKQLEAQYADYAKQFGLDHCMDKMEQMFMDAVKAKGEA